MLRAILRRLRRREKNEAVREAIEELIEETVRFLVFDGAQGGTSSFFFDLWAMAMRDEDAKLAVDHFYSRYRRLMAWMLAAAIGTVLAVLALTPEQQQARPQQPAWLPDRFGPGRPQHRRQ